jgi:hypothetical protein
MWECRAILLLAKASAIGEGIGQKQPMGSPRSWKMACREGMRSESTEPLMGRLGNGTAKASRISRDAVKSRCACEWGGWGRLSVDGPGQNNPDWSEDPWGRAARLL